MSKKLRLNASVTGALYVGGAATLLMLAPALRAQDSNAPTVLKPTVVTGSLIPTAETIGVAPVETLGTVEIQKAGSQDILSVLKTVSPAFAGNGNIGQSLNNGGFGESYVALRNLSTLLLIDGKRVNITPFSTYVGTYAADVNMIPLAMIDHIEVLKDGASALYGSDALGGVINIITKKEYSGAEVNMHYGFGMDQGEYNEYRMSAVVGVATNGTRIMAGGQYYKADPLYTSSRKIGSMSSTELAQAGLFAPSYYSPSYNGHIQDASGNFILAGSPFAQGAGGYIPGLSAPPRLAGMPATGYATIADYNAAALADPTWSAAHPGKTPYIAISSTPAYSVLGSDAVLNTTELGTVTLQGQDRRTIFANAEQDLFSDHLTIYGQLLYSVSESKAQLAPSPISSLNAYNLFVPADNPYNPFGIGLGSGGSSAPRIRSRLVETGNRSFVSDSSFWHLVGGLKGNVIDNKYHYDVNADYSQTTQLQTQNSGSSVLLNQAMTPGAGGLSQLGVPIYNIFALPGANDPATVNAIKASANQYGFSDLFVMEGVFRGDLFDLPAGPFQLAVGGQYFHESLSTAADPLLQSGNLIGLNPINVFPRATREREAGFAEGRIPVLSPDQHVPGVHSFEISTSGRFETISSGGTSHNSLVPKVGFLWQPLDEQVTVRGTYSQGYNVPFLTQLYGPSLNSQPYVVAPASATDRTPTAAQQNINYYANPDLPPSTAETMTIGAIFKPKALKDLTVSVDYYHIEQPTAAFYPAPSAMVADLNAKGNRSVYYNNPALHGVPVYQDLDGNSYVPTAGNAATAITADTFGTLNLPLLPNGAQRTEGIDLSANYKIDTGSAGTFNLFANANLTLGWDVRLAPGTPWLSYSGQYTDAQAVGAAQGMIPDYNISLGFTWSIYNFDYTVLAHYLPSVTDYGDLHPSVGNTINDFTANGQPWKVDDYYKIDMQLAYSFKSSGGNRWYDGTRVAIGVNNVTDNLPPLIASSSEDNTDKSSYDILGRFIYFELSKKF